jgi:hypothetical protein
MLNTIRTWLSWRAFEVAFIAALLSSCAAPGLQPRTGLPINPYTPQFQKECLRDPTVDWCVAAAAAKAHNGQ